MHSPVALTPSSHPPGQPPVEDEAVVVGVVVLVEPFDALDESPLVVVCVAAPPAEEVPVPVNSSQPAEGSAKRAASARGTNDSWMRRDTARQ